MSLFLVFEPICGPTITTNVGQFSKIIKKILSTTCFGLRSIKQPLHQSLAPNLRKFPGRRDSSKTDLFEKRTGRSQVWEKLRTHILVKENVINLNKFCNKKKDSKSRLFMFKEN